MDPITSENPKIINKTFDLWWLDGLNGNTINTNQSDQSFALGFRFIRGRKVDGVWELSRFDEDVKTVTINDVFAYATEQAQLGNMTPATLLEGITTLAATVAKAQGVID